MKMKKGFSVLLVFQLLLFSILPTTAFAAEGGTGVYGDFYVTVNSGKATWSTSSHLSLEVGGNYKVEMASGKTSTNHTILIYNNIEEGEPTPLTTVTLRDVHIATAADDPNSSFKISDDYSGDIYLILEGDNSLSGTTCGIEKSSVSDDLSTGGELRIGGTGSLEATGGSGAGIGASEYYNSANITIAGGTITAIGGTSSAGIGGGEGGSGMVNIHAGVVTAIGGTGPYTDNPSTGIGGGSGIGGGGYGKGVVNISGGIVTATGGDGVYGGCGIGGANRGNVSSIVNVSGGIVTATGGDSIYVGTNSSGSGLGNGDIGSGVVNISGGTVTSVGGKDAYGFGYADHAVITGGSVYVQQYYNQPTDGSGNEVKLLTARLVGGFGATVYANTSVRSLPEYPDYGMTDVKTDGEGKLYLWLPANAALTEIVTGQGIFSNYGSGGDFYATSGEPIEVEVLGYPAGAVVFLQLGDGPAYKENWETSGVAGRVYRVMLYKEIKEDTNLLGQSYYGLVPLPDGYQLSGLYLNPEEEPAAPYAIDEAFTFGQHIYDPYGGPAYSFTMPAGGARIVAVVTNKQTGGVAPTITSGTALTAYAGQGFSFDLAAEGDAGITWSGENLPSGVSLLGNTLSGKLGLGNYSFSVTAANSSGSHTASFTLTVSKIKVTSVAGPVLADLPNGTPMEDIVALLPKSVSVMTNAFGAGYHPVTWHTTSQETYDPASEAAQTLHFSGVLPLAANYEGLQSVVATVTVLAKDTSPTELAAPANPAWDADTPAKATWSPSAHAAGYSVQLYKDGAPQGGLVPAAGTECDFTGTITEGGSYTFTVTAKGDGTSYTDSAPSAASAAYVFSTFVPVTDIFRNFATSVAINTDLPLSGTVFPANATNKIIGWSVNALDSGATDAAVQDSGFRLLDSGTAGAVIQGGVFRATAAGTATVTATITNGAAEDADYTKEFQITVTDDPVPTYAVTVTGGTGGGEYAENDPVTIVADAPEANERFKEWTISPGVTFTEGSASTSTATFTMPGEAVTAIATYEDIPAAAYTVTYDHNGGSGTMANDTATQGVAFTLPACAFTAPMGQQFKEWAIGSTSGRKVAAGSDYTFTADTTVYAVWENQTPTPTRHTIAVSASPSAGGTGSGGGTFDETTSVTVEAVANPGYHFVKWTEDGAEVSTSASYTFDATADRALVAVFETDMPATTGVISITTQPAARTAVTEGRVSGTLSVEATVSNGSPLFYTWYDCDSEGNITSGNPLMDARDYPIPARLATGTYYTFCRVTANGAEPVDSNVARIIVAPQKTDTGGGNDTFDEYYTITATTDGNGSISPSGNVRVREGRDQAFTITPEKGYVIAEVWVDGKSAKNQLFGNSFTFENVRRGHTIKASFMEEDKVNPSTGGNPFTDVSESDWFFEDVMFVYSEKMMMGTSDTRFSPYGTATRGMMATILWRMEGSPAVTGNSPYGDLESGKYYTDAVIWAARNNIFKGYEDNTFRAEESITREQLAAIFYRYAGYKGYDLTTLESLDSFSDKDSVSSWAKEAMQWAVGSGLILGKDNNLLDPQGTAIRAEIAAMLHRFIKKYELV